MSKAERSRIEKIKYRLVVNYLGDTKLASKARSYSDERFVREFGLPLPKRMPKIKEKPTARQISARKRIIENYQLALQQHEVKEALELKNFPRRKIESSNEYKDVMKNPKGFYTERDRRRALWVKWSKANALPPALQKLAVQTNQAQIAPGTNRRYDPTDKYGYAAVFYAFTQQESLTFIRQNLEPDIDKNLSPDFKARKRRR